MNSRQFFTTPTMWGKIIGAFFGYLMAGPAGALFGLLIGNLFDRGLRQHAPQPFAPYTQETRETVKEIFFEALFSLLGQMSKADGRVSSQEILLTKQLMQKMQLNQKKAKMAQHFFNLGKQTDFNPERILTLLYNAASTNRPLIKLFIDTLYQAARVDGITNNKLILMNTILRHLSFDPLHQQGFYENFANNHNYDWQKHRSTTSNYNHDSELSAAYKLLKVSPNDSKQTVKHSYRQLMSQNHPDKLIAKGFSKEKIKAANETTQKIRKAYELIIKSKGWK